MTPACAQACPTASIQFGPIAELRKRAGDRVKQLHDQGKKEAYIYGDEKILGGLNSFYLLIDKPEVYGLPANPKLPSTRLQASGLLSTVGAVFVGVAALLGLRSRRDGETVKE
jgi:formate dehydrogenase iron-sulfur subunit